MRPRALLTLALVVALAAAPGCINPYREEVTDKVVAGRVDGDAATNQYYKLYVDTAEGVKFLADFDRGEWYVAGIEKSFQRREIEELAVRGEERLIYEVVTREVLAPESLREFRYDTMKSRAESRGLAFDREALDAEWDLRLAERARDAAAAAPDGAAATAGGPAVPGVESPDVPQTL